MDMDKAKRFTAKESLLDEMAKELVAMKFSRQDQRYTRSATNEIVESLHINYSEVSTCIGVTVHLGIRHETIENIALGWNRDLSKKVRSNSATWGAELSQLVGRDLSWEIRENSNVQKLASSIVESIIACAIPILNQKSKLEAILADFSAESFAKWRQTLSGRALRMPLIFACLDQASMATKSFEEQYALLAEKQDLLHADYPVFVSYACDKLNLSNPFKGDKL